MFFDNCAVHFFLVGKMHTYIHVYVHVCVYAPTITHLDTLGCVLYYQGASLWRPYELLTSKTSSRFAI